MNAQAKDWSLGPAADRLCPEGTTITVREAFDQEAPKLMARPEEPYPLFERVEVKAGKTPYVRFDLNDYSIPHTHVRKALTVFADLRNVRVADKHDVIALHDRSYDKGAQIEDPAHIQALARHKHGATLVRSRSASIASASRQRAMSKLVDAVPACRDLLIRAADLFFELVSRRYQCRSTLITTNKPFAEWSEVFPNAVCVVSLVDRLVHNAEVIDLDGESYRNKEAQERAEMRAKKRKRKKS